MSAVGTQCGVRSTKTDLKNDKFEIKIPEFRGSAENSNAWCSFFTAGKQRWKSYNKLAFVTSSPSSQVKTQISFSKILTQKKEEVKTHRPLSLQKKQKTNKKQKQNQLCVCVYTHTHRAGFVFVFCVYTHTNTHTHTHIYIYIYIYIQASLFFTS